MESAVEICQFVEQNIEDLEPEEIAEYCQAIRDAPYNAMVIAYAKHKGWWDQSDEDTCDEIRQSLGNRALAIIQARLDGWWDQDDATMCAEIRKSPGEKEEAIEIAIARGWWV